MRDFKASSDGVSEVSLKIQSDLPRSHPISPSGCHILIISELLIFRRTVGQVEVVSSGEKPCSKSDYGPFCGKRIRDHYNGGACSSLRFIFLSKSRNLSA